MLKGDQCNYNMVQMRRATNMRVEFTRLVVIAGLHRLSVTASLGSSGLNWFWLVGFIYLYLKPSPQISISYICPEEVPLPIKIIPDKFATFNIL